MAEPADVERFRGSREPGRRSDEPSRHDGRAGGAPPVVVELGHGSGPGNDQQPSRLPATYSSRVWENEAVSRGTFMRMTAAYFAQVVRDVRLLAATTWGSTRLRTAFELVTAFVSPTDPNPRNARIRSINALLLLELRIQKRSRQKTTRSPVPVGKALRPRSGREVGSSTENDSLDRVVSPMSSSRRVLPPPRASRLRERVMEAYVLLHAGKEGPWRKASLATLVPSTSRFSDLGRAEVAARV